MVEQDGRSPEYLWLSVLFGMTALITVAAFVLGTLAGVNAVQIYFVYISRIFMLAPLLLVAGGLIAFMVLALSGAPRPLQTFATYFEQRFGREGDTSAVLGPILMIPLLMGGFGTMKQLIPMYFPFSWDDTFARLGYHLFFNHSPWQLTHSIFGSPLATLVLDRLYAAWVPLLFLVTPAVALAAPPLLRARFFLSFGMGFILIGVLGAYYFSSAGPCFAANLHTETAIRYIDLMARLHAIDASGYRLSAIYFQDHLWQAYQHKQFGFGLGISAMPSMHNAVAVLYALAAGKLGWRLRTAAWSFAALILIASVHLGWHYAADGFVAWAAMAVIWISSGWYLRWCGYERAVTPHVVPQLTLVADNGHRIAA